ncbi:MAG: hypothetical protein JSU69_07820 [Candidatus Zixiibacteriota bacterium]|nr:MAG: hypothetical protein JSU69_07820 [candidate division Zixibacteria bacterium]
MNDIMQQAATHLPDAGNAFTTAKVFIQDRFGTPGLIAAGLLLLSIVGLLLSKAFKMSFDIVRYVVVPAMAVTFVATYFLPYSFVYILPVTVAFFSIVLIVKG